MNNPEKLATQDTQDEEKQYLLDPTMCKQTQKKSQIDMSPPTNN